MHCFANKVNKIFIAAINFDAYVCCYELRAEKFHICLPGWSWDRITERLIGAELDSGYFLRVSNVPRNCMKNPKVSYRGAPEEPILNNLLKGQLI